MCSYARSQLLCPATRGRRVASLSILRLLNYHFTQLLDLDEVTNIFCGSENRFASGLPLTLSAAMVRP
jgi:hypothetical protein